MKRPMQCVRFARIDRVSVNPVLCCSEERIFLGYDEMDEEWVAEILCCLPVHYRIRMVFCTTRACHFRKDLCCYMTDLCCHKNKKYN